MQRFPLVHSDSVEVEATSYVRLAAEVVLELSED